MPQTPAPTHAGPVAPAAPAATPLARVARRAVLARLETWPSGRIVLRLPGGETAVLGDPAASESASLQVHDERFFRRVLLRGELGAGESYVDGDWDSEDLVALMRLFCRDLEELAIESPLSRTARIPDRLRHLARKNSRRGSERNVSAHYDVGNDFYRLLLGESWVYSCALFERPDQTLDQAQRAKLERVCDWLELGPEDHLLDIGCGWGELCLHAARTRGCRATGVTLSREQLRLGRERVQKAGLAGRVELRFEDYRELRGHFDKIASIEMVEAVGAEHLEGFFARAGALLPAGGRLLLQSITMPEERAEAYRRAVDWAQTYVFPGSYIPPVSELAGAAGRGGRLRLERLEEIGESYAPTIRTWRERFLAGRGELPALGLDRAFERTWDLYLAFAEASFAERTLGDAQMLFIKR